MSYVSGALLFSILDDLAFLWTCECFVNWTVLLSGPTTYCYVIRTLYYFVIVSLVNCSLRKVKMSEEPGPSEPKRFKKSLPLLSPLKKKPKPHADMTSNEKTIAVNIYKYVQNSMDTYPYEADVTKKTAEIMGTSEITIRRILKEYKTTGKVSTPDRSKPKYEIIENLDDFTLSVIKRKVHEFYFDNDIPTVNKVLKAVNDDEDLPNFKRTTMFKILKKLKFKYSKRSRRSIVIDRPDLMVWRKNYLLKIKDFRKENKKIYYMDETWVNEGHTSNYVWVDGDIQSSRQAFLNGLSTGLKNPQKGKRLILVHIGSADGFLEGGEWIFEAKKTERDGDYHGEMDAHNFEKWFEKILGKLEPGSVVVMDNAPYHSRLLERVPNTSWRKADIQKWLQEKNIGFKETEIKAELLKKIHKENYKQKVVDVMAATKNVTVLRLPPYHCELNPIELIWAQLKSFVGRNNKTFKMAEVKELIQEGLKQIGTSSWAKCVEHIIKEEDKMKDLDGLIDLATDQPTPKFIINLRESSDSDSYSDESE